MLEFQKKNICMLAKIVGRIFLLVLCVTVFVTNLPYRNRFSWFSARMVCLSLVQPENFINYSEKVTIYTQVGKMCIWLAVVIINILNNCLQVHVLVLLSNCCKLDN